MEYTRTSTANASAVFPALEPPVADAAEGGTGPVGPRRRPAAEAAAAPPHQVRSATIRASVMSFANIHEHGELLVNYLKARREIFIDRLHWNVAQADGMEFDQYDTPFCRWVVLHEFGVVLAGVRLVPTTAKCGMYSYMLRDAQQGLLPQIPTDALFFKAPVDPLVWEASRFFITDTVSAARRATVQRLLFENMSLVARQNGAQHILGIVPAVWSRWARRLDADATPIGARFSIDGTSSQCVQFSVNDFIDDLPTARPQAAFDDRIAHIGHRGD